MSRRPRIRPLPRPLRAVVARARTARDRLDDARDVRAGQGLQPREDRAPVFLLGVPRSGTTVMSQLLVEGLDVGWLANAHLRRPGAVSRIERSERPRARRAAPTWTSSYGATSQAWEPHEGGPFWYRFLPRDPHELGADSITERRLLALRAAVRGFADACGAPVLFKNTLHTLRVPVLAAALPEARFVLVHRSDIDTARSILRGRVSVLGDPAAWLSARPLGWERIAQACTPAEQVVWQVRRMQQVAARDLAAVDRARVLHLEYDAMCDAPRDAVAAVHAWLTDGGVPVQRRSQSQVPGHLVRPAPPLLDEGLEEELCRAFEQVRIVPAEESDA